MHTSISDPQCVSSANNSAQWLKDNFGFFSTFASVTDFYKLNQNFSGVNRKQQIDLNALSITHMKLKPFLRCKRCLLFVFSPAGGSSSLDSQSDSRDAAGASSCST